MTSPAIEVPLAPAPIGALRAWSVVLVLLILATLASIDRNAIALMIDPIKASFDLDDFQMGLLQGPAFAIFFLIGSLPMGWIVDRFSKNWTIYLAVTLWSLATIACGLAESFVELLVARCLVGLGEAALHPAGWSIVARLFPPHRLGLAISILSAGAQVGAAGSYLLGGFLIAEASRMDGVTLPFVQALAPWQLVFIAAGIPGLLLGFLIFIAPRERRRDGVAGVPPAGELAKFVRMNRAFLLYHFLGFGLLAAMVFGAAAWVPTYLLRNFDLDIRLVGLILAFAALPVGACGVVFAGWLVDRSFLHGRNDAHLRHFAIAAALAALVGGLGFAFGSSVAVCVLCFGLIQFIQPFSGVAGAVLQIATPSAFRGRISAAFILFYNVVGMTLGPSLVAFLADQVVGESQLGLALALNYAVLGAAAAGLLWRGRIHAHAAVLRNGRGALEDEANRLGSR